MLQSIRAHQFREAGFRAKVHRFVAQSLHANLIIVGESHLQVLSLHQLGFNQNYNTFTLTLLTKIVF
jgi:hypothetical protein